jgi:hypothetical protein
MSLSNIDEDKNAASRPQDASQSRHAPGLMMMIMMTIMIMHHDDKHSVGYLILPHIDSTTSAQT